MYTIAIPLRGKSSPDQKRRWIDGWQRLFTNLSILLDGSITQPLFPVNILYFIYKIYIFIVLSQHVINIMITSHLLFIIFMPNKYLGPLQDHYIFWRRVKANNSIFLFLVKTVPSFNILIVIQSSSLLSSVKQSQ